MTFKIGVERTKLVECFSLDKKKKKQKYTTAESHKKTVYGLQKKEAEKEEDEEYSAPTKMTRSMRLQSELFYYRKRGSVSIYCAWGTFGEREREREREIQREKDGSDVTIVALKLAMSFGLLLAKNVHLSIGDEFCAFPCQKICPSVSPLLIGAEFTLSVAKDVALFETVRILRTVKWRDWQGIETAKQTIEISSCTVLLSRRKNRKNESN